VLSVCCYFQIHQPHRLRPYSVFDVGRSSAYFDDAGDAAILRRVATLCYAPMALLLLEQVRRHGARFRFALSFSGSALEQLERHAPATLALYQRLVATGCVELLAETSHHSLAFLFDRDEFDGQVALHADALERLFGFRPSTFRNTELIYSDALAAHLAARGYLAVLAEGADAVLGFRSPDRVYRARGAPLALLLRNHRLSDDVAFRFQHGGERLSAAKLAGRIQATAGRAESVNLFMDLETFGEHLGAETGIFELARALPAAVLAHPELRFQTPAEVAAACAAPEPLSVPSFSSWADRERDTSAWLGNGLQRAAARACFGLLREARLRGRADVLADLRRLSASDHVYYMCTKRFADGEVHARFTPHESPYDAYVLFMNVLNDVARRLGAPAGALGEEPYRDLPSSTSISGLPAEPEGGRMPRYAASVGATSSGPTRRKTIPARTPWPANTIGT
jgi:alpha-amylase